MHELAIAESILDAVVSRSGGQAVSRVDVRIGALRQVVPDALTMAWAAVTQHTEIEGAALVVTEVPAVVACTPCGVTTELVDTPILQCSNCDSFNVTLVSGEEFDLASFDRQTVA